LVHSDLAGVAEEKACFRILGRYHAAMIVK
jgi:hypothetical protein